MWEAKGNGHISHNNAWHVSHSTDEGMKRLGRWLSMTWAAWVEGAKACNSLWLEIIDFHNGDMAARLGKSFSRTSSSGPVVRVPPMTVARLLPQTAQAAHSPWRVVNVRGKPSTSTSRHPPAWDAPVCSASKLSWAQLRDTLLRAPQPLNQATVSSETNLEDVRNEIFTLVGHTEEETTTDVYKRMAAFGVKVLVMSTEVLQAKGLSF